MAAAGREAVASAEIVKLSREELAVLSGSADEIEGIQRLWHPRLEVLAVTDGEAGATLHTTAHAVRIAGYPVSVVDTVGCGDAFTASLLAGLLGRDLSALDAEALGMVGRRACAAGAIVATRAGAMTRMPTPGEIDNFISEQNVGT
jgi:fructokinase